MKEPPTNICPLRAIAPIGGAAGCADRGAAPGLVTAGMSMEIR